MKLIKIELSNCRQYANIEVSFGPGVNIIYGNNAVGKSSILEAIHYLITLRSSRNATDKEVMRIGTEETVLYGEFFDKNSKKNAIVLISKYFKKMSINDAVIKKASEYVGFADVISFGTEDVDVVSGSPLNRRKMMDLFLSQLDSLYMNRLREYKKILKERNVLLKNKGFADKTNKILLEVLDNKLAQLSMELTNNRKKIIEEINESLFKIHNQLSGEKDKCLIQYVPSWNLDKGIEQLIVTRNKDFLFETTTIGPHRDDYVFYLEDRELSKYGSQGQKKISMLSFKLACVELLKHKKQRNPILLLDDVFGELDTKRHNFLLKFLENDLQTIITTPSLRELEKDLVDKAHVIYLEKEEA